MGVGGTWKRWTPSTYIFIILSGRRESRRCRGCNRHSRIEMSQASGPKEGGQCFARTSEGGSIMQSWCQPQWGCGGAKAPDKPL